MATYDRLAELPIQIEGYSLEGLERQVTSEFSRLSTLIRMHGGGEEGVGEDVTYDALDHIALQDAGPVHDFSGPSTLGELCERVERVDLFPSPPVRDVSQLYRTWAYESAALDLALRQAGISLHEALGREPAPVTFHTVVSVPEPVPVRESADACTEPPTSCRSRRSPLAQKTPATRDS